MRVAGLDLSLASTGVAVVELPLLDLPGARWSFSLHRLESEPAGRQLRDRSARYQLSRDRIGAVLGLPFPGQDRGRLTAPDLVVVEGPSLNGPGQHHDMSWHWGSVVDLVLSAGCDLVEVSPHQVKLYATGSGSSRGATKVTKQMVKTAVCDRYGVSLARAADGQGSDVIDAFVLAALGCRALGHPIEPDDLPAAHLRALDKLRLPERITVS